MLTSAIGLKGLRNVAPPRLVRNWATGAAEEKLAPLQVKVTVSFNFGATIFLVKSTQLIIESVITVPVNLQA
ncbi:hypothetical protein COW80_00755 [Candidatus Beckwithbacteria bacterium CG22_combo_CG10-13_8_21_14_all_01_47_9]|uniref:Uncharacterized protein n=1 Tax=Candidatus Beckwithbacteria bacterium CG22_combo_CG10-13_8_21_14_all_01_47_9 TaxID=1974496 RepID=A0A2H0E3I1_9BACT|nr:MAG: hypothetical protein COW80_00755 [Candidatus Beckwithbacteria bacterium CG22_combo_CG10-13_8_21_14_all_01_47_9]